MSTRKKGLLVASGVAAIAAGLVGFTMIGTSSAQTVPIPPNTAPRVHALQVEQRTAACMSAQGFSYVATVPGDIVLDEAFQQAEAEGKSGDELVAVLEAAKEQLPPDPNELAVQQMPASQAAAFTAALVGTESTDGCTSPDVNLSAEEQAELDVQTDRAEQALAAAPAIPAVKSALVQYKSCMAAAGFTVTTTEDIDQILEERAAQVRPAETAWPEEPAADATPAQQAAYAARIAVLEQQERNAEAITTAGTTTHETCVKPYDDAFAAAYVRLTNPR